MILQHVTRPNDPPAPILGHISWRTLATMVVALLPLLVPARAHADLSSISNDAVFGTEITLNSQVAITGNVGVGQNGSLSFVGGGNTPTISGTVFLGANATDNIQGTTSQSDLNLTTAVSAAIATASSNFNGMSSTSNTGISDNGSQLNNGTAAINGGTITGNGGTNVVDVKSINGSIFLKGTANDIFIINTPSLQLNSNVILENSSGVQNGSNGVTANHVLFNVTGTSNVSLSGTLNGTFLVPTAMVSLTGGGTLTGAILDGQTVGIDFNAQSGTKIIGDTFSGPLVSAPEPTALVKGISGLATIGIWGFFRRKRSKSK
jgi:hypothetical protein